jgi:putative hemolysin
VNALVVDVLLIVVFIVIGGAFAAAEIALVSLTDSQVRRLAETRGARGRRVQRLVGDPNTFLASVQIGVTVATMLSSAVGAATLSGRAADWLTTRGFSQTGAEVFALVVITLIISFFSLVVGELAPKRLGLQRSESIALAASGLLTVLARLFRPVVRLLGASSDLVVRILGGNPRSGRELMSQEDLRSLVLAHESLNSVERRMIVDVFDAEKTRVREVMVPRPEVTFLPADMSLSRAARTALGHPHSRYPVIGGDADDVIGVVHLRDLVAPSPSLGRAASVRDVCRPVTVIPGTKVVLQALQEMRSAGEHLAVVVDEYGGTDGIVTLEDLVEEIVGEMESNGDGSPATDTVRPVGGARVVDGRLNLDDFAELTGLTLPPGPYDTAAGFLMAGLGRMPSAGDAVRCADSVLTVAEMDGRRVSRIEVRPAER